MAKIKLTGAIVDNDTAEVYQWFGFDAISAKAVDRAIKALEEGENLEIDLNSPGGYCSVGAEIYTMLRQASADSHMVTVNVVGEACSAATVLMCGADEVKASDVAMFMFHNASLAAKGKARDMRSATECLEQTDESIVNAYVAKTGKSREELHDLIDAETWMSAQRALEFGFVDGMMFEEEQEEEQEEEKKKNLELFNQVTNRIERSMQRVASSSGLIPEDKLEVMREAMMSEMTKNSKVAPVQPTEDVPQINDVSSHSAVNINTTKGGSKMTLQEAYQLHPELKDEVSEAVRNAVAENEAANEQAVQQAVQAERTRIQEIEAISASIPADMVTKAKFEEPCDAKELAFNALKADTAKAQSYMANATSDAEESGANDVVVQPDDVQISEDDEAEALANHVNSTRAKK